MRESESSNQRQALGESLVEAGRRMRQGGLVVANEGNLSARLAPNQFLVSPAGADKGDLTLDALVEVDLSGSVIGVGRASTEIDMHLEIYRLRPDVQAVVHAHPPHATAFAVAHRPLVACVLPEVICSLGCVPLTNYGTPSTPEVGAAVGELILEHDALLLRNHGVVTCGATVRSALNTMELVERLAQITWLAGSLGGAQPLEGDRVDQLLQIRGVYGLERPVPACLAAGETTPKQRS